MDYSNYNFDDEIVKITKRLQRDYKRVFPYMVMTRLDLARAEGSLRRDMARLAREGRLERVGGFNTRRGYCVPTLKLKPVEFAKWEKVA